MRVNLSFRSLSLTLAHNYTRVPLVTRLIPFSPFPFFPFRARVLITRLSFYAADVPTYYFIFWGASGVRQVSHDILVFLLRVTVQSFEVFLRLRVFNTVHCGV